MPSPTTPPELRDALVNRLIRMVALGGLVAYLPSVALAFKYNLWWVVGADTLALALVAVLALRPSLPTNLKIATILVLSYGLGLALIVWTGPTGAGHLFVFAFVFFAVLFYGQRGMVGANALAIATHGVLVLCSAAGLLNWEQRFDSVVVISVNYVLVSLVLTAAVQFLLAGQAKAANEERRMREVAEVLLKEIEHRAKNNLQVVSSLVTLRSRGTERPERALDQIRESLSAMAAVQQLLYRQNDEYLVRVPDLLHSLIAGFQGLHPNLSFRCQWTGPVAVAPSDWGVSLGLLLNEIVMNSVRHGFPEGTGVVEVEATYLAEGRLLSLVVADTGRGMGNAPEGTGSRIIRALALQLSATLALESGPGTRYRFQLVVPPVPEGESS